ncbi:HNH endonuclease [Budviciaceae bacterium BWR-B9]|uniref:HNH endonuclease n=2 Tax=Budviciaceae TaxID=1903416 RepID=A0ABS1IW74_9GAMM|nr:HNH endonuclease [Limnobaculum allomyrinae]
MIVVSYENWHSGPREIKPGESQKKRYISDAIRLRIFKRDGYQCKNCGINKNLTIDHIYPISLGGTSEDKNLQTLCMSCNSSKGANV